MLNILLVASLTIIPCGTVGEVGGLPTGTDLTRYTIDVARYPEAICNDGTPAVFYYAPSTRDEDRHKWVIFLQGGGGCRDGQSCAQRWCSIDTNFGMDKMTTSLSKPSIRGDGFLEPSARNRFGTWNRVLVYYCSSDTWQGTSTATVEATDGQGRPFTYTLHFRGSRIVDAVLDTLRNVSSTTRRRVAVHATTPWPDLDEATHVLFAGSSAGAGGVVNNVDRVAEKLRATNPTLVDYRGVIDATYSPKPENLDYAQSTHCMDFPMFGCSYEAFWSRSWAVTNVGLYGGRGDQSCATWHAANDPGTEWRCADDTHVIGNHLTTPFFLRQDLQDSLLSSNFAEARFGTRIDFGRLVEQELRAGFVGAEEPPPAAAGAFVPQCADHESFTNDEDVYEVRVGGLTFHDTLWNWWSGAQPQQRIATFTGTAGAAPGCP